MAVAEPRTVSVAQPRSASIFEPERTKSYWAARLNKAALTELQLQTQKENKRPKASPLNDYPNCFNI